MTVDELRKNTREFIFASHICPDIIPCNPSTFRRVVRNNPDKVPFPILIIGSKLYIGRRGFLAFIDGAEETPRRFTRSILSGDVTR